MNDDDSTPTPALTVADCYDGVLEQLGEVDGLRLRLLGQADAYHALIAAGYGALRLPSSPPPPPTPIPAPDVAGG